MKIRARGRGRRGRNGKFISRAILSGVIVGVMFAVGAMFGFGGHLPKLWLGAVKSAARETAEFFGYGKPVVVSVEPSRYPVAVSVEPERYYGNRVGDVVKIIVRIDKRRPVLLVKESLPKKGDSVGEDMVLAGEPSFRETMSPDGLERLEIIFLVQCFKPGPNQCVFAPSGGNLNGGLRLVFEEKPQAGYDPTKSGRPIVVYSAPTAFFIGRVIPFGVEDIRPFIGDSGFGFSLRRYIKAAYLVAAILCFAAGAFFAFRARRRRVLDETMEDVKRYASLDASLLKGLIERPGFWEQLSEETRERRRDKELKGERPTLEEELGDLREIYERLASSETDGERR